MKSARDDDNRRFQEAIKHIQSSASQLTLEAMENYYEQLTLTHETKLGQTSDKLSQCMQQLKKLVTEEEWMQKQQTHEEFKHSLTNKQDKFPDKLTNKRANKSEKLQNPGAKPHPPRKTHNERTCNEKKQGHKSTKNTREENRNHQLEVRIIGKVNKRLNDKTPTKR